MTWPPSSTGLTSDGRRFNPFSGENRDGSFDVKIEL
jgi:hypothetical protein